MENEKITLSIIKADIGGFVGNSSIHPALIDAIESILDEKKDELIFDYSVNYVGDDINIILLHNKGENNQDIHKLGFDAFKKASEVAKELKLHDAGEDLLSLEFKGNLRELGPTVVETSFIPRKSEPIIVFAADKTESGAFNYPLFKMFGDPFNTSGLVIDPKMHSGFKFEVLDLLERKKAIFSLPEDYYDLLAIIGTVERFVIKKVYPKDKNILPEGEVAAIASSDRLNIMAGKYVGKDDPILLVRCQSGLPAVGEVLEAFSFPYLVNGWMRGAHWSPLLPVSLKYAKATRFDGPARVVALGFQVKIDKLIGPNDLFDDIAFDNARQLGLQIADYLRRHGPFEPERISLEDLKETRFPEVFEKLKARFENI